MFFRWSFFLVPLFSILNWLKRLKLYWVLFFLSFPFYFLSFTTHATIIDPGNVAGATVYAERDYRWWRTAKIFTDQTTSRLRIVWNECHIDRYYFYVHFEHKHFPFVRSFVREILIYGWNENIDMQTKNTIEASNSLSQWLAHEQWFCE